MHRSRTTLVAMIVAVATTGACFPDIDDRSTCDSDLDCFAGEVCWEGACAVPAVDALVQVTLVDGDAGGYVDVGVCPAMQGVPIQVGKKPQSAGCAGGVFTRLFVGASGDATGLHARVIHLDEDGKILGGTAEVATTGNGGFRMRLVAVQGDDGTVGLRVRVARADELLPVAEGTFETGTDVLGRLGLWNLDAPGMPGSMGVMVRRFTGTLDQFALYRGGQLLDATQMAGAWEAAKLPIDMDKGGKFTTANDAAQYLVLRIEDLP